MKKLKLKADWKRIRKMTVRLGVAAAFVATFGFTEHRRSETLCREVEIRVDDSLGNSFVDRHDIRELIRNKFGNLDGKRLLSINISLLEKIIDNNPFVLKAQVFSTVDGKLVVEVRQRVPVVRIINAFNESFYIDEAGVLMPLSYKFTARVPVANGNIFGKETDQKIRAVSAHDVPDTNFHPTLLEKIFMVVDYIRHDEFWNAQIEQLYVNADGELELVPKVGSQIILFGDEKHIEEKFSKLFTFYKEGLSKTGWEQYKTINVTFKDQIVCTKK